MTGDHGGSGYGWGGLELLCLAKEAADFDLCVFGAIRGVADVEHAVGAKVAADGAFIRFLGVGGPQDGAHARDDSRPCQNESYDGAALHKSAQFREERLAINDKIDDMRIVFAQDLFIELHHFEPTQAEPLAQQSLQNDSGEVFEYAVRLKQNERSFFLWHRFMGLLSAIIHTILFAACQENLHLLAVGLRDLGRAPSSAYAFCMVARV